MNIDYYKIPFGAQLLIWTTRIAFYGSCRTTPNKYEIIDIAYEKVGIKQGSFLLKTFLEIIKKKKNFKIQPFCKRYLNETEINLINCIEVNKNQSKNNEFFVKEWDLVDQKKEFGIYAKKLAKKFREANLNTNVYKNNDYLESFNKSNKNFRTLH